MVPKFDIKNEQYDSKCVFEINSCLKISQCHFSGILKIQNMKINSRRTYVVGQYV